MKNFLLVTASLIALGAAAPAVAADLAARPYTKAPPMVAAVYDWTGFYIGANGGWGSSRNSWDLVGFGAEGSHDATGGTVGGQVGYRWQAGPFVFGLEAQGNWADSRAQREPAFPGFSNHRTSMLSACSRSGRLCRQQRPALRQGRCCVTANRYHINTGGALACDTGDDTRWGGAIGAGLDRLRPELVGWRRIQSPVHAGPYLQLHQHGRLSFGTDRIVKTSTGDRPPEPQVRRPDHLALLIFRYSRETIEAPGVARGLFPPVGAHWFDILRKFFVNASFSAESIYIAPLKLQGTSRT